MSGRTSGGWWVPVGLVALSVVPVAAGSVRLAQLSASATGGATGDPDLVALVAHVSTGIGFSLLGALQFAPSLRRRGRGWHRVAGRLLVPLGLAAALSALWLALLTAPSSAASVLLLILRLGFGSLMVASLVAGWRAIRQRQLHRHRAWMTRAYAIGIGAGTQAFTIGFGQAIFGRSAMTHAVCSGAAWALNLAVAEWSITRHAARPAVPSLAAAG
jgi:uncharacterized membrane protein